MPLADQNPSSLPLAAPTHTAATAWQDGRDNHRPTHLTVTSLWMAGAAAASGSRPVRRPGHEGLGPGRGLSAVSGSALRFGCGPRVCHTGDPERPGPEEPR